MRIAQCVGRCALGAAGIWGLVAIVVLAEPAWGFISLPRRNVAPPVVAPPPPADFMPADRVAGAKLFEHRWAPRDVLSEKGDGIGPVYNAVSCVECHRQGGIGGGGGNDHDVELATLMNRSKDFSTAVANASKLEPAFSRSLTVLLHSHGTAPGFDAWRLRMQNFRSPAEGATAAEKARHWAQVARRSKENVPVRIINHDGFALKISRRNTPALFGLGLIDKIPDAAILAEAARQREKLPATAGRTPTSNPEIADPYSDPAKQQPRVRVGKFGWRGQIGTLREFVLAACSNELGLETPGHPQPGDPLSKDYKAPGLDITHEQCENMASFVAALPRPQQQLPANPETATQARYGERVFHTIGCTACHAKQMGEVDQIYSDLLLHDLGAELADPVPANKDLPPGTVVFAPASYYGGSIVQFAAVPAGLQQEWRTPPLWGVRDSSPYMHDGRAPTLLSAIALHGGQATASRQAFRSLPGDDQTAVLLFLTSLAAPTDARPVQ